MLLKYYYIVKILGSGKLLICVMIFNKMLLPYIYYRKKYNSLNKFHIKTNGLCQVGF